MKKSKPNIVIYFTDDQGYGDLSCMGATDFSTPVLDKMANEGVRFTDWYSNSPVCSPSRASLLSGKYPSRAGVRSILRGHRTATGLPPVTKTIASLLKENDYQTAITGKWHLGLKDECRPYNHGFEKSFGFYAGCIDFYSHIFYWGANRPGPSLNPTHDLWENNEEIWKNGEYFTELIADKAIQYLREMKKKGTPIFLYIPFNAPHYPMHAPQKYLDRFPNLPWDRQIMAAMISAVDDAIGKIQDEIQRLGLSDNTLSFFTSDNGPSRESRNWLDGNQDPYYGGTTGKLKGHKFSLFDGGIKVPSIIHWPNKIKPKQISNEISATMDIFPTIMDSAGIDFKNLKLDGISLLPHLTKGHKNPERPIFWEMENQKAIRKGKWKLVLNGQLVEDEPKISNIHLSDLESDPGEKVNLVNSEPKITEELMKILNKWIVNMENDWKKDFSNLDYEYVAHEMV